MSSDPNEEGSSGLASSVPLVTISSSNTNVAVVQPAAERLSSSSVSDHPLASSLEVAATNNDQVSSSERPPATMVPTNVAPPPPKVVAVVAPKSLDEWADDFLSQHSPRIDDGLPPLLYPDPLPQHVSELERLRVLVERRAWGDVLSVAGTLLRGSSSHYAPIYSALFLKNSGAALSLDSHQSEVVEIMALQCQAWLQMRRYKELHDEIQRWSTFLKEEESSSPSSWIPWSLHILAAASWQYTTQDPSVAVDGLCQLRERIPNDQSAAKLQVEHALSNTLIRQKDYRLALECLENMMEYIKPAAEQEANQLSKGQRAMAAFLLEQAYKCHILSQQGRILLQVGALAEALEIFQEASSIWTNMDSTTVLEHHTAVHLTPAQLAVNEGLLCFAYAKYDEALEFFRKAVNHIRKMGSSLSGEPAQYRVEDWLGPFSIGLGSQRHALYSETMNNMAVCGLYSCKLHESIHLMESLVRENPTAFLTERVAFNLCTLYELGSDNTVAARKKRVLQLIAKRFFLHDIGPESFRVN